MNINRDDERYRRWIRTLNEMKEGDISTVSADQCEGELVLQIRRVTVLLKHSCSAEEELALSVETVSGTRERKRKTIPFCLHGDPLELAFDIALVPDIMSQYSRGALIVRGFFVRGKVHRIFDWTSYLLAPTAEDIMYVPNLEGPGPATPGAPCQLARAWLWSGVGNQLDPDAAGASATVSALVRKAR